MESPNPRPKNTVQILSHDLFPRPKPLPVKVLQFGTGILLRGLPGYFIDKANRQGIFNASIAVVKSTPGSADGFPEQDNLYTTLVKGMQDGVLVDEKFVNSAIASVTSANDHWPKILELAKNPGIQIIISNTTEVGIQYVEESIFQHPPQSFPAKLLGFLYERYRQTVQKPPLSEGVGGGRIAIIPTELIPDNGTKLKEIVQRLVAFNQLEEAFATWLGEHVFFCNSLVDRIVTNASPEMIQSLPYEDRLAIQTEPYRLWAIEGNDEVRQILSFAQADSGVVIAGNIEYYRERKLRLLNGTHTISVCLSFLRGFDTVYEMMRDTAMAAFVEQVAIHEIAPSIPVGEQADLHDFARDVLDRFRNPVMEHRLLNITLQATSKMRMRNVPTLLRHHAKFGGVPAKFAEGFAAYLLFMKSVKVEEGNFYGLRNKEFYQIRDDFAGYFHEVWQTHGNGFAGLAVEVCQNTKLWGEDLTQVPGFAEMVGEKLASLGASLAVAE